MATDVTAIILAGGRATRLGGIDKRELVVEGETIFMRQCAVLAPRVDDIIVSARAPVAGYRTVVDTVEGGGPLAGIVAGLAAAPTAWTLVVAGDMPFIRGDVVDHMLAARRPDVDAVALRVGGLPQPLFCVLRTSVVLPRAARRLAAGQRKAADLLLHEDLRVGWIEEPALRALDPELRCLINVNEPGDLGQ